MRLMVVRDGDERRMGEGECVETRVVSGIVAMGIFFVGDCATGIGSGKRAGMQGA